MPRLRVDILIASGLYTGFLPLAPATFGSLWALPLWCLLHNRIIFYLLVLAVIFIIGLYLSSILTQTAGSDPRFIVIDEIVGLLIAFFPIKRFDWRLLLFAFILFRVLDVLKPFPIRKVERIGRGVGVMLDDVLAGVYAGLMVLIADKFIF